MKVAELTQQLQAERILGESLRVEVADMPAALEALGSAQVWYSSSLSLAI